MPTTSTPGRLPDVAATRLWVTAVGLVGQAEEALARGSALDYTAALILSDTASEAVLGLLASNSMTPSKAHDSHERWLLDAARIARMRRGLVQGLRNVHALRNQAIHNGYEASVRDAERAIAVAQGVLEPVPRVLKRFGRLSRGAGVASAVADIIEPHPAAWFLGQAQTAIARRRMKGALEAAAGALDLALGSVQPSLPKLQRARTPLDPMFSALRPVEETVAAIGQWVTPIALGLRPTEYAHLRRCLPTVIFVEPQLNAYHWPAEPDDASARWAVERVTMLILRLWEAGSLTVNAAPKPTDRRDRLDGPITAVFQVDLRRGKVNQRGGYLRITFPTRIARVIRVILETPGITFARPDVDVTLSSSISARSSLLSGSELEIEIAGELPETATAVITEMRFDVALNAPIGVARARLELVAPDGTMTQNAIVSPVRVSG